MSETITLPRSGLVLTETRPGSRYFVLDGDIGLGIQLVGEIGVCDVWWPGGGSSNYVPTLGRATELLDSRVLALRSALLPADARDRVARALLDAHSSRYAVPVGIPDRTREDANVYADAVLAALGGGK